LGNTDYSLAQREVRSRKRRLVFIYNENLEFLDEYWVLDVDSPSLEVKQKLKPSKNPNKDKAKT
jgi:hypothetical protein